MDRGVVNHASSDGIPRSAVDDETVAQRQDPPFVVKPDFDLVHLVARMTGAHQMLAAVLDPLHRPPEPARQERNQ